MEAVEVIAIAKSGAISLMHNNPIAFIGLIFTIIAFFGALFIALFGIWYRMNNE